MITDERDIGQKKNVCMDSHADLRTNSKEVISKEQQRGSLNNTGLDNSQMCGFCVSYDDSLQFYSRGIKF